MVIEDNCIVDMKFSPCYKLTRRVHGYDNNFKTES